MNKFNKSPLWESNFDSEIFTNFNIETFKNEGANNKIAQYNSKTHSILFLKNILFNMANNLDVNFLKLLKKIKNRSLGGGITINFNGINCDLDYLLAIGELQFLDTILISSKKIMEIGAGYGRTCHSILSTKKNIENYYIIDLPEMLILSNTYLQKVLNNENYVKIKFISIFEIEDIETDLILNIDSMQEMDHNVVLNYLKYINTNTKNFYCKNTVGKFAPELCGWEKNDNSILALNSGLLKDQLNIFNPEELLIAQDKFLIKFLPTSLWKTTKHSTTSPWSHYYQALFSKISN